MKQGWTYKKLGEVANVVHGKNQKEVQSVDGNYPIYGSGGNIMGYATDYLCEAGTTILGRKGSINNPQYIEERFWNVDTAFGISAKEGNDSKYLFYYIQSVNWLEKNTGTTLPSLTQQVVKSVELAIPSLSEQQRIASRLDAAFAHIDELKANAEKQVSEARTLFQKALEKAMEPKEGWEEKTIGDICDIIRGKRFVRADIVDEGIPCIHYGDIYTYYGLSATKTRGYIKPELAKKMRFAKKNDVVVVQAGENNWDIGVGVAYFGEEPAAVHDACFILKHMQNPMYISYFLRSYNYHRYLMDFVHEGKICSFLKPALEKAPISLPPLSVQHRIVSRLDSLSASVRKLEESQRRIMSECDALKQALLRKVFE